jgi:mRNA interferase RelE/StbE
VTYAVEWSKGALKTLVRVDRITSGRIVRAVERLAVTGHGDVKKLAGSDDLYRLRLGDWRVIFTRDDSVRVLFVERIAPRGGAYG